MHAMQKPSFEEVLTLARHLPATDRLRLIAQLAQDLAATLVPQPQPDAWDDLLHVADETATLPPTNQDSADVVSAMRR